MEDQTLIDQFKHIAALMNTLVEELEAGKDFGEAKDIAVNKHGRFKYHIKKHMARLLTSQVGILG